MTNLDCISEPIEDLDLGQIEALWKIIQHHGNDFSEMNSKWIPFVKDEKITRLGSTFRRTLPICELYSEEHPELAFVSEDDEVADLLVSKFNVCDLESPSRLAQQIPSMKNYLKKSEFNQPSITSIGFC